MAKATAKDLNKLKKADLVALLTQLVEDGDTEGKTEDKPLTSKQQLDSLVDESDFTWTSGRVYLSPAVIESAARVAKTGNAEIVKVDVEARTAAIGLYRTDKGSVAAQNLRSA